MLSSISGSIGEAEAVGEGRESFENTRNAGPSREWQGLYWVLAALGLIGATSLG
jgi:hypothetical protein